MEWPNQCSRRAWARSGRTDVAPSEPEVRGYFAQLWMPNRFGSSIRAGLLIGDMILTLKTGGNIDQVLTRAMFKQVGGTTAQRHAAAAVRQPIPRLSIHGAATSPVRGLQLSTATTMSGFPTSPLHEQSNRRALWCPHRKLSSRHEDRPPDLAARRLCRGRSADGDRSRCRASGRRLGHEQLAGHRQLPRDTSRSTFDPLRRAGRDDLFRHRQTGARAADRPGAATLVRLRRSAPLGVDR
jgi:hypothetical protein